MFLHHMYSNNNNNDDIVTISLYYDIYTEKNTKLIEYYCSKRYNSKAMMLMLIIMLVRSRLTERLYV